MTVPIHEVYRSLKTPGDLRSALNSPDPHKQLKLRSTHRFRLWLLSGFVAAVCGALMVAALSVGDNGGGAGKALFGLVPATAIFISGPVWLPLLSFRERRKLQLWQAERAKGSDVDA